MPTDDNTVYTREAKLPPEIFVKFRRRFTRDVILKTVCVKDLYFKGNKINILKEISWRIQQQRKEYFFLTKLHTDNKIQYKWLFLEYLNFIWEGKPVRLDLILKARRFAINNAKKLGYQPSSKESASDSETHPGDVRPHSSQQGATGGVPKPPGVLR